MTYRLNWFQITACALQIVLSLHSIICDTSLVPLIYLKILTVTANQFIGFLFNGKASYIRVNTAHLVSNIQSNFVYVRLSLMTFTLNWFQISPFALQIILSILSLHEILTFCVTCEHLTSYTSDISENSFCHSQQIDFVGISDN